MPNQTTGSLATMSARTIKAVRRMATLGIVVLISIPIPSEAADCPDEAEAYTDASVLVECINSLKKDVVPSGAVMAFDIRGSGDPDECPDGWSRFRDAGGRVIIGAGSHSQRDMNGKPLTNYTKGDNGGEEEHTLATREMPNHSHGPGTLTTTESGDHSHLRKGRALVEIGDGIGGAGLVIGGNTLQETSLRGSHTHDSFSGDTEKMGSGEPHNNMPPYVALNFCKKD